MEEDKITQTTHGAIIDKIIERYVINIFNYYHVQINFIFSYLFKIDIEFN